jgi:hypothetical protein
MLEKALNTLVNLLDFFGRLLLRPFRRPLGLVHRRLDQLILERPGFWGDLWRLFHRSDWQRSARFNARIWVVGFSIFYPATRQLGHAWWVNLGVTLGLDLCVYLFHKRKLWPERRVSVRRSCTTWYAFWAVTFLINLAAAWVLFEHTELGRAPSKGLLAVVGILVNPWVFRFRDKVAIRERDSKIKAV